MMRRLISLRSLRTSWLASLGVIWLGFLASFGFGAASQAQLERTDRSKRRHVVRRLCGPCPTTTTGQLILRRPDVEALFDRRMTIVVTTSADEARGVLRLQTFRLSVRR